MWKHRLSLALTVPAHLADSSNQKTHAYKYILSKHTGAAPALVSPIRHLNHQFNEHSLPPNTLSLSLLPPSDPRTSLAAHSNVSDSACFQCGADTLSIIIRGFAESWGLGNLPGCVKVSMRKASSCLQKRRRWTEILRKVRMLLFVAAGREGRREDRQQLCFQFEKTRLGVSNARRLN